MKDSFYFPHDYHARHDPKLERLRMEVGPVGDGIYWDIVEMLYEEGGYLPLKDIPLLAKTLNTTDELLQKVVKESKLFSVNGKKFYSESLLERLRRINAKRRKARISGRFGGLANAKRTLSERVAIKESKESKVKKGKESKERGAALSPQDFISSLKTNPAYKGIDIDNELGKMDAWLLAHPGRQKTKRFIINWLNKIEVPLGAQIKLQPKPKPSCDVCKGTGYVMQGDKKAKCFCW